jgi:hypothetical protein
VDRSQLVIDICKESGVRQPSTNTDGYLPQRVLVELLLALKQKNDETKRLRGVIDAAEAEKKDIPDTREAV